MRAWKFLIVLSSAAAALAIGVGDQIRRPDVDFLTLLGNAINALT